MARLYLIRRSVGDPCALSGYPGAPEAASVGGPTALAVQSPSRSVVASNWRQPRAASCSDSLTSRSLAFWAKRSQFSALLRYSSTLDMWALPHDKSKLG